MKKAFWKDLSRVEIGIITVALSIILAFTLLNTFSFRCLSQQSEARFWLKQIYNAQRLYHEDYDTYISLNELKYHKRILLPSKHFTFETVHASRDTFEIKATQKNTHKLTPSIWSISHKNALVNIQPGCET